MKCGDFTVVTQPSNAATCICVSPYLSPKMGWQRLWHTLPQNRPRWSGIYLKQIKNFSSGNQSNAEHTTAMNTLDQEKTKTILKDREPHKTVTETHTSFLVSLVVNYHGFCITSKWSLLASHSSVNLEDPTTTYIHRGPVAEQHFHRGNNRNWILECMSRIYF